MNKNVVFSLFVIVILGSATAGYFYRKQQENQHKPQTPKVVELPLPSPAPAETPQPQVQVQQSIEPAPVKTPLPQLNESDSFMLDALTGLISDKSLRKYLRTDQIIHHIAATIDNLPRRQAPINVLPVKQVAGKFLTAGKDNEKIISPKNASRYTPYVRIAELIDAKQLVELYVRLYPLFQQAYEELGYPKHYFNDRLIITLNDLLAAPVIKQPVKLVQPSVYYKYADPDLEALSIGQRILIRIGSDNEEKVQNKLIEIKQQLLTHMHDKTIESTE